MWNAGCPPTLNLNIENHCARRWRALIDFAKARRSSVRLVVLSTDYSLYLQPKSFSGFQNHENMAITRELAAATDKQKPFDSVYAGSEAVIANLEAVGIHVALIRDVPALPYESRTCLTRRLSPFDSTTRCTPTPWTQINNYETPMLTLMARIARNRPGLHTFDPTSVFCDSEVCHAILQNQLLYWDDNHLNENGSRLLASSLSPWLRRESVPTSSPN
jgi:hypothetical protein